MEIGNIKRIRCDITEKEAAEIFCDLFCFYAFP